MAFRSNFASCECNLFSTVNAFRYFASNVNTIMRKIRTSLFLLIPLLASVFIFWSPAKADSATKLATSDKIQPNAGDARVAYFTARLLEEYHYSQHPLDTEMSQKFFDGYIDMLDGRHEHFLQSDLDEFASYRTNLDKLTVGNGRSSDLTPAYRIYSRFAERFQQHIAYANELLAHEKFKFTADEKYVYDRRHEPFPKDLAAAKNLWRQQLRYDFLQEKLSREISETNGVFTVKLPATATTNITANFARHYRWQLHMMTNSDAENVLQIYLLALSHAYDPHSDYFSAPKAQDFSMQMNLSLFGIGAKLQEDDGFCVIKELVAGGPAAKSKNLKVDDRIIAVAQAGKPPVDVVDMELEKVVQMIRGPKNTEVHLTISPAEDRAMHREITLIRDEIKLEDAQAKAKIIEQPDGRRIGIIDLPSFYAPVDGLSSAAASTNRHYTSTDVALLLQKLKAEKISGLILDLRSNPGGSLEEAVKFTGLFIKEGPIVLARNPDGRVLVDNDPDPEQIYDGPLVVMVNRFSASASEIAAAALQDYNRALIVGDTSTHGKGTVQNLNPLQPFMQAAGVTNPPGTLKITIRKFYRINGGSTQFKGVVPDIIFPDKLNYSKFIGESALDNALPWDTIRPVEHEDYHLVQPYSAQLLANSTARLMTNQDFKYIREDIDQFVKLQEEKAAPLNEREAIKQREHDKSLGKSREKERDARPTLANKFYELSIADAAKEGLPAELIPAPIEKTNSTISNLKLYSTSTTNFLAVTNSDQPVSDTNSVSDVKPAPPKPKSGDDPMLEETQRILNDYISLLKNKSVTNK